MSRFLRMAYGHGGTKSRRILVSVPPMESAPAPLWLRLALLAVWIVVPVLVSLYAIPKATRQLKTVIDISRLEVKSPPEPERPVVPEPRRRLPPVEPPVERPVEPPMQPSPPAPAAQKPQQQPTIAPPAEVKPPSITRPTRERSPEAVEYKPRIARERAQAGMESGAPAATRIRRETAVSGSPSEIATTINRTRGATAANAPAASERVTALRRAPAADGLTPGRETTLRPITRKERSSGSSGAPEGSAPRIAATRERTQAPETAGGGSGTSIGIARGISLASLGICSSPQEEEDDIRAVLSVVGSRQSCTDEKGEFQLKATKRVSSFNLIIFPAKGRRPSNRCEELKNAYTCLKTH